MNWPFWLQNLLWSPRLVPSSNHVQFLGQVPASYSSKRFVWTLHWTNPCDQSLLVNSSGDSLQGLVTTKRTSIKKTEMFVFLLLMLISFSLCFCLCLCLRRGCFQLGPRTCANALVKTSLMFRFRLLISSCYFALFRYVIYPNLFNVKSIIAISMLVSPNQHRKRKPIATEINVSLSIPFIYLV